ncbi:hypothetical protein [Pectobacterium aroidearum]|uniref:hypothetical protein n=1 Tax=Pectobacterium aroidearum TaxID=1201031 RepID=UPI003315882E
MFNPVNLEPTSTALAQIKILHEISLQSNDYRRQLIDLIIIEKINEAEENLKIVTSTCLRKEFIESSSEHTKSLKHSIHAAC